MMRAVGVALAVAASVTMAPAAASESADLDVFGLWLTAKQTSKIEIGDCGDATPCGRIVWIDADDAQRLSDSNNPDPLLRAKPLVGLTILNGFEAKGGRWANGQVNDPETGKSYPAKLRRRDDGALEVTGCLGPLCQTRIWTPTSR